MIRRPFFAAVTLGALLLGICPRLLAQTSLATITGAVTDPAGGRIPGASVEIKQQDTGRVLRTVTNGQGEYNVTALEPGTYTISSEGKGFGRSELVGVSLHTAETKELNFTLKPGASETVVVAADSNLLETSTPTLGATVSNQVINDLPLPDRSALQVVTLVPVCRAIRNMKAACKVRSRAPSLNPSLPARRLA